MFVPCSVHDQLLNSQTFMENEVQFNLLHIICESQPSLFIKSVDEQVFIAQATGRKAWLWVTSGISIRDKQNIVTQLCTYLTESRTPILPALCGDPDTVNLFAEQYAAAHHLKAETNMVMQAYYCPQVTYPSNITGVMEKATPAHIDMVATCLVDFYESAFGISEQKEALLGSAEQMIRQDDLYVWVVDGQPVSMANISHRSPRHARINAVSTPVAQRKKGYASGLIASLCTLILQQNLTPMLYADMSNPDSNNVYKKVGFVESGLIHDITFAVQGE
ncbi:GNAT family N-acetyltransferase [Paenibacillus sp. 481]|uniref:GNAT family N-acetyltransferase n=1 Tax=Paenibacillus sp. 481 TaxID=2835869 RepID=UPI001E2DCCF3|nr:GNAT family N-acetyltransferase [Paenibacillus sp. 481]UHA75489.1 GNAT family N-acetyltransferase [Paenibacillus sp. 481]